MKQLISELWSFFLSSPLKHLVLKFIKKTRSLLMNGFFVNSQMMISSWCSS